MNKETWMSLNGFDSEDIYIVGGGNTYDIKDELKQNGFRYNSVLGWYSCDLKPIPAGYSLTHFTFDELYKWEPQFQKAFIYEDTKEKIKKCIYINKEKEITVSQHIGTIGERLYDIPVEFQYKKIVTAKYHYYIYNFKAKTGTLVWLTKKDLNFEPNQKLLLTGTVVAHQNFSNNKTTKVNRCIINTI